MSRPGALPAPSGTPGGPSPLSHFVKLRKLGEGGFGKVFLVRDERDGQSYVMKEIDVSKLDARGRKEALKECAFLARMHHPNIIGYKEFFEVSGPPQAHAAGPWNLAAWGGRAGAGAGAGRPGSASTLYIVMSYADGGDLEARIKAQQKLSGPSGRIVPFPEQQIIDWFIQTALAIKHIHDRKILHRDIKTQNIFLTKLHLVKLGDFGIARDLSSTMAKAMTQIGTPFYLSPEICSEKPYDAKSDMWALGVVLYELMCLRHPFGGQTMKQLIMNIVNAQYAPPPSGLYSRPLTDLVGFLLQKNPKHRPSVNQLLRFPFIQQHIGRFLSSHKIQEEFSHTILHGAAGAAAIAGAGAAAVAQRQGQPRSAAEAHAKAQQLAAQQEAERARDAHQQQAAQARAAQEAQARAAAAQRAKQIAVEQARQAAAAQARAHAEALAAQRARYEAAAESRARLAREAALREREKQAARDAANRQEAGRRADERARAEAREREQAREARADRDRIRHEALLQQAREERHAASAKRHAAGAGAGAGLRASPPAAARERPPWVGVIEPEDDRDEQREREREREKERERERERERLQQQRHFSDRAPPDSLAPTMVRPIQRDPYRDAREQQARMQQQQHQQQGQHSSPRDVRRAASAAAAEPPPSGSGGGSGMESRSEKAAKQRAHEEQLALARKQYFEERKALERRQKNLMTEGAGAPPQASPAVPQADPASARGHPRRDEMPVGGGGGGGGGRAPIEAAPDRPRSAVSRNQPSPAAVASSAAAERGSPAPLGRKHSADAADAAASGPGPRVGASKAAAMAAKEAELARLRVEYFEERKRLQARKQRQLEEAGLVPRSQAPAPPAPEQDLSTPVPAAAAVAAAASKPTPAASTPAPASAPKKLSRAEQMALDRAEYFRQQKKGAADSVETAAALGHEAHLPGRPVIAAAPAAAADPSASGPSDGAESADDAGAGAAATASSATDAAQEAEEEIEELAVNTHSCEEMIQLMDTMRMVMASSGSGSGSGVGSAAKAKAKPFAPQATSPRKEGEAVEEDGEDAPATPGADDDEEEEAEAEEEEEEEYQFPPPTEAEDADAGTESETGAATGTETDTETEADEDGAGFDGGEEAQRGDCEGAGGAEGEATGEDLEPATEAECSALEEFNTFRAEELRDAIVAAQQGAGEPEQQTQMRAQAQGHAEDGEGADRVQDLSPPTSSPPPSASPSSSSRAPSSSSALYNASATIPPNKVPVVTSGGVAPAPAPAATPDSSLSTTSSFPRGVGGGIGGGDGNSHGSGSGSGVVSAESSTWRMESLRQFLAEKLGDDLLLDIFRLLRRSLQHHDGATVTTVHSTQASPNVTGVLHSQQGQQQQQQQPTSARRGSMSSLIIGPLNVRELLYGSGLLGPTHTKYVALIMQLVQSELQLYGQL